jgi:hypothetical protein
MDDNTRGFTGQILNVVVTWGEGTLKLRASPFITVPNGIMQKTYQSQDGHPLGVESLPVGLTETHMALLEETCLEELEHKLANQDFVSGVCCWRTADVSRSILETVYQYYNTMPVVSQPSHLSHILLTFKTETPSYPHHPSTPASNTRHQQPTNLHRLLRKNDPLSHPDQIPLCRILLLAPPQPPNKTHNLQNLPPTRLQSFIKTRESRSQQR